MIIERIDRAGHVLEMFRFAEHEVTVGRGYNNGIVLHDPHIDVEHIRIKYDMLQRCFQVYDLDSTNGLQVLHGNKPVAAEKNKVRKVAAGDTVVIGKTRLRLVDAKAPLLAAVPMSRFESAYKVIGAWWVFLIALFAVAAYQTFDQHMNTPYDDKLSKELMSGVFLTGFAIAYGIFWSVVAKVQHHDARFFLHANLALGSILILSLLNGAESIVTHNAHWLLLGGYWETVVSSLLAFFVVLISISQMNQLRKWVKYSLASVLPAIAILTTVATVIERPEFRHAPNYPAKIVSPSYQWVAPESEEAFLQRAGDMFASGS